MNFLRAGLHDDKQGIKDIAKRMFAGERKVSGWIEEHIDRRRQRSTTAVSQHDDQLQIVAQMIHRKFQAAENFRAQAVAGHAYDKKVIWPFVEYQFDRHAGI